ncbi:hypothetical protein N7510_007072 [Penicillium lagena]|uniref:uncharacterized protein n=1 Tax=Penicillium lagena TaxID=94218 RepID=UPI00254180F4|nr:uncharacterized protein N7510_007072 [Penicillium lagena]KAJ5610353.1 hypothetical protein N7510_007072 [Penicillium lagena]
MGAKSEVKVALEGSEDLPLLVEQGMQIEDQDLQPDYLEDTDATEYEEDEDDDNFSELLEKDIPKKPDDLLLEETSSESSFVDIGESTQTTFPHTDSPYSLLFSDNEMLLLNDGGGRQDGVVLLLDRQDEMPDSETDQMLCG